MMRPAGSLTVVTLAVVGTQVSAVDLNPGDIITTDFIDKEVRRIDPVTGQPTTISSGGLLALPGEVVLGPDNEIFVIDAGMAPTGEEGIIEIDPATGNQTVVHTFSSSNPVGLALDSNGDFIVSDWFLNQIIRIDGTGAKTIISSGGQLNQPWGICLDPVTGDILVAVAGKTLQPDGKIVRVDPATGQQTVVASGGTLVDPRDVVVGPGLQLYVVDDDSVESNFGQILRIDPLTGDQTRLDLTQVFGPFAVAIGLDDMVLTADPGPFSGAGSVDRADPFLPGDPDTVISSLNFHPIGIAVVAAGCPWDCDGSGDGIVGVSDLLALLSQYDPMSPNNCTGGSCDYDGSGCVDVVDLLKMLSHYDPLGVGCP